MQQKWGIPDSAPAHVHDALYAIMGNDCSALSDVQALANHVHEIVTAAPAEQQAELIKAFYLPNGVLKEYAQHDPGAQVVKMHSSILSNESADVRKKLNELIGSRIKNLQDTTAIDNAIKSINLKLSEAPQKPVITPQGGSAPTPSAPDPEPEKDKKAKEISVYKNAQKENPAHIVDTIKKIKEVIRTTGLTMSKTVERHFYELVVKGAFKGEWSRPYMRDGMNLIIEEIIAVGIPEKDQYLSNGLRWVANGAFRGKDGVWELVIDLDKYEVVHFLFN